MILRLLLGLTLCAAAQAQTISIAPQGQQALRALTGKRIQGIQILGAIVCPAEGNTSISGGAVYREAIALGFTPIIPVLAQSVITQAVSHNWRWYAIEAFKVGSIAAAGLGAGRVVAMSSAKLAALVIAHQIGDELSARAQERIPNAGPLISSLLDPEETLDLGHRCKVASMLALFPNRKVVK